MTTTSNPYAELIEDRADWLLDAIAAATQDRRFLRGDPEYDEVAGEAILLNGAKAIRTAISQLTRDVEELVEALQELAEAVANDANGEHGISGFLGARLTDARDALAHITLTRLSREDK